MDMFNWNPDPETTRIVSKYIWIYVVVAVPLTITVLLTWRFWVNKENKKHGEYEAGAPGTTGKNEYEEHERTSTDSRVFRPMRELMGEYSEARREQLRPPRRTQFSVYGIPDSP